MALVATPAAIGLLRVLISRNGRAWAVAFLVEALALIALLAPLLLPRLVG